MTSTTTAQPFDLEIIQDGPHAGIAVLRLEQADKPVVVLDQPLIQRIEATLNALPDDLIGLILASASQRVFIAGADLKAISQLDDAQLDTYLAYGQRVFGRLSQLPFPTAAAINGAALGGGLEIAMHCDGLIGSPNLSGKPYPVGLPEAGLSICPGWGGTNLLPARIDPATAITMTASGNTMMYDQACQANFFDATTDEPHALIDTAAQWILDRRQQSTTQRDGMPSCWIGRHPAAVLDALNTLNAQRSLPDTGSASAVVAAVDAGLAQGWQAALDAERSHLITLRNSPEGKAAIEAFFERSKAKSK